MNKGLQATKRVFYIVLFTLLGILLQFLLHAAFEMWYIGLLLADFETYSLGFSWEGLLVIHHVGTIVLLVVGAVLGSWQGLFWWERIYNRKKDT